MNIFANTVTSCHTSASIMRVILLSLLLFSGAAQSLGYKPVVPAVAEAGSPTPASTASVVESYEERLKEISEQIEQRLIRSDYNPVNTSGGSGSGQGDGQSADGNGSDGDDGSDSGSGKKQPPPGGDYGYDTDTPAEPAAVPGKPKPQYPRPKDVGTGTGDDVVAKSIREAAEKEPDPAIRKRLWEEYRRYKKSQ